jgi:hypothetical protein
LSGPCFNFSGNLALVTSLNGPWSYVGYAVKILPAFLEWESLRLDYQVQVTEGVPIWRWQVVATF